jgi:hypothetical protein
MIHYELEQLRVEGALPDLIYKFGDKVRLKSGERAGEVGRIVALISLEPAPYYVIEFPDGLSENAIQHEVERARQ